MNLFAEVLALACVFGARYLHANAEARCLDVFVDIEKPAWRAAMRFYLSERCTPWVHVRVLHYTVIA
jgi:hypothetical protein